MTVCPWSKLPPTACALRPGVSLCEPWSAGPRRGCCRPHAWLHSALVVQSQRPQPELPVQLLRPSLSQGSKTKDGKRLTESSCLFVTLFAPFPVIFLIF